MQELLNRFINPSQQQDRTEEDHNFWIRPRHSMAPSQTSKALEQLFKLSESKQQNRPKSQDKKIQKETITMWKCPLCDDQTMFMN